MSTATVPAVPAQRVEAARYALLRRLAYAMRHHMVVHLQPIGMIIEVMDRRLDAAQADLAQVHEALGKVNRHARAAVQSSLDVVGWLAPEEGQTTTLAAGVAECVDLLRSHLAFRGFTLRNEVGELAHEVSRAAVRCATSAVLLALTDRGRSPAALAITAHAEGGRIALTLSLQPAPGDPGFGGEPHYRLLEWADVEAIAAAEGVLALRDAPERITLVFPG